MPTFSEVKATKSKVKLKLRRGDKVIIISGKDKGQKGWIGYISPKEQKALVLQDNPENPEQPIPLNAMIKHYKAKNQGEKSMKMKMPSPIHISNLMLLDPKNGEPTKIGRRSENGTMVRYAKKSDANIEDAPIYNQERQS